MEGLCNKFIVSLDVEESGIIRFLVFIVINCNFTFYLEYPEKAHKFRRPIYAHIHHITIVRWSCNIIKDILRIIMSSSELML